MPDKITKLARGQPCLIRVPQYCIGGVETTVACHIRMAGISGMGLKAPSILVAFGCRACHDVCDGRTPSEYSYAERRLLLLEGMCRTQNWLIKAGYLKW